MKFQHLEISSIKSITNEITESENFNLIDEFELAQTTKNQNSDSRSSEVKFIQTTTPFETEIHKKFFKELVQELSENKKRSDIKIIKIPLNEINGNCKNKIVSNSNNPLMNEREQKLNNNQTKRMNYYAVSPLRTTAARKVVGPNILLPSSKQYKKDVTNFDQDKPFQESKYENYNQRGDSNISFKNQVKENISNLKEINKKIDTNNKIPEVNYQEDIQLFNELKKEIMQLNEKQIKFVSNEPSAKNIVLKRRSKAERIKQKENLM